MVFWIWTKKISVGIDKIDDQHKKFIGLVNDVYSLSQKSRPDTKVITRKSLDILEYARYHFTTEEDYFDKYNFPDATAHRKEHMKLLKKAISLSDRISGKEDVIVEFLEFLKDWLEDHIRNYDLKYAEYFKKIGVIDLIV